MEKKLGGLPLIILTFVLSLAGFFLRHAERAGGSAAALIAVSVLASLGMLAVSLLFWKERDYARVFAKSLPDVIVSCLGAAMLLGGCVLGALNTSGASQYISVLGAVSALALLRASALRWAGQKPGAGWYAPLLVFYIARLFCDYRQWMVDPAISDYCFMLFAMLSFMLAFYYAAVFSFDRGSRRALLFFSMTGIYFGAVSLAGAEAAQVLLYGGSMLCLAGNLWQAGVLKTPEEAENSGAPEQA